MAVLSVEYLCFSISLSLHKISQIGPLVGILWKNLQECDLCFIVRLTWCCFQPGYSKRNGVYWCAYRSQCMASCCYFPYLLYHGCILIRCSVLCHSLVILWTDKSRCYMVRNHLRQLLRPQWILFCSFTSFWICTVPSHIQITYHRWCGSLVQVLSHMRYRPMCIIFQGCLPPW